jgi:hypothetical protein
MAFSGSRHANLRNEELAILSQGLSDDLNHFKDDQAAAKQIVTIGELANGWLARHDRT